ncbi:thermonuclease family protein [Christiangramia portivictoriae]|uniref:thermonuclease family protein n=1 Tax=Christiangramia portivictoriae TaxID=326069 RepID=UPI00041784C5|nr:thermonuclease family protein [Christiangramia portivictoriae]
MNFKPFLVLLFLILFGSCEENVDKRYPPSDSSKNILSEKDYNGDSKNKPESNQKIINGKVIKIADGDTFTMLFENGFEVRVRLDGIDTPERKQPYSKAAKKALSNLIFGKNVTVYYTKKDGYGRVLGEIFIDNINVNRELVRQGLAWHYKKYSDDRTLAKLEKEAQLNKMGLWQEPNPVAPWTYRKNK